jgi:thymidylate synthase
MIIIHGSNVNDAFYEAMWKLPVYGLKEPTRGGECMVCPSPVTTVYENPTQRMLFHPKRDANPFFHVMEAMWMLAGRRDVDPMVKYNKRMSEFSDDGFNFHGAYGYRWRQHFVIDQIYWVVEHLRQDPMSRRAVIAMWDPQSDIPKVRGGGRDVPCNTHIYFKNTIGRLDMTVCCRSNDAVWGCYGANAVHMSYLQELVAMALGMKVGKYYQISNNFHIYERHYDLLNISKEPWEYTGLSHYPLLDGTNMVSFLNDLANLFSGGLVFNSPYVTDVIKPLQHSWGVYKAGDLKGAIAVALGIGDGAIRRACESWLRRRLEKRDEQGLGSLGSSDNVPTGPGDSPSAGADDRATASSDGEGSDLG